MSLTDPSHVAPTDAEILAGEVAKPEHKQYVMATKVPLTVLLESILLQRLDECVEADGRTRSEIVTTALVTYFADRSMFRELMGMLRGNAPR